MSLIADAVLDAGLQYAITNGTRIDICSSAPANYAAVAGVSLGNKGTLTVGAQGDRTGGGRKVTVPAITDGDVTADGTASHWALTDGAAILVAVGTLAVSTAVENGDVFTLAAFDIGIPDAA